MAAATIIGYAEATAGSVPERGAARRPMDSEARWSAWMAAAQAGDGQAYAALLRDCVPLIRSVVIGSGVRASAADDVVQEVLLAVHRARHTFDPEYPFLPWLRTIAHRRAIDSMRQSGRRGEREVHAPENYEGHPDPAPSAWHALDQRDEGGRLHAAVATLPEGQRQAVELLGLRELSLEEASTLTGRTKTALKVNLHRALRSLRVRLGKRE